MNISQAGLDLIYDFEGRLKLLPDGRYKAYRCPAGVWTIFVGCTKGVHEGMIVTEAEGEAMFRTELAGCEAAVIRLVTAEMTQPQFDALVSFTYNCGAGALQVSSLLKKFNRGDIEGAAKAFAAWNKATVKGRKIVLRGLVRRRAAEMALFLTPEPPAPDAEPEPEMPQDVEQPGMSAGQKTMVAASGLSLGGVATTFAADPVGTTQTAVGVATAVKPIVPATTSYVWPALIVAAGIVAAVLLVRQRHG